MTIEFLTFLAIGAVAGGFVNGFAGFGTSLFALGWWLQVMPPLEAVAVSLVMSLVSGFQGMLLIWSSIQWSKLIHFLLPAVLGIPVGLQLLAHINAHVLTIIVAFLLIAYGGFFAFKSQLPNLTKDLPIIDAVVGFAGGILGSMAGLSGALPTMLCSMRPWTKMQQRAILQPYNYTVLGISAVLLYFKDAYTASTIVTIALAIPITVLSAMAGIKLFSHVSDTQFRRLLIALMLLSGLILLTREVP